MMDCCGGRDPESIIVCISPNKACSRLCLVGDSGRFRARSNDALSSETRICCASGARLQVAMTAKRRRANGGASLFIPDWFDVSR